MENSLKNTLQRNETVYEAVGKNTARNSQANREHMVALRRGNSSPRILSKRILTSKYVKASGINNNIEELKCTRRNKGVYNCQAGGRKYKRRQTRRRA